MCRARPSRSDLIREHVDRFAGPRDRGAVGVAGGAAGAGAGARLRGGADHGCAGPGPHVPILFANMLTCLLDHETAARLVWPAGLLARERGLAYAAALITDVPGQALTFRSYSRTC